MADPLLKKIAFIGNYLPRRCGIATFTTDLCESVAAVAPGVDCLAVAMNDRQDGYPYPQRVHFEIEAGRREQYDLAADFLNVGQVDVACVQHEFGIFGGRAGRYLISLLRHVRTPIVTTLHTVLNDPQPEQRQVMMDLCELSDRLVVMSPRGEHFLKHVYGIPAEKIRLIHHGIPDMPFVDSNYYKDLFGAEGRRIMLTFGLLSPGKGIEFAIEAMRDIVKRCPDVLYIVLGATHPHVKRDKGEEYRVRLEQMVREFGLEEHVMFLNRFVDISELCEYIGSADIYVTPYLNESQITSGTLAYAMGNGKAVVSTPYWYAEDMLQEDRGVLVPFRNGGALAESVVRLLENDVERHAMRKRAYTMGRTMIWPEVAAQYRQLFEEVRSERVRTPRSLNAKPWSERVAVLPDLNPAHLLAMTDSTGILQHARFNVPDPHHGYCTDDQARALIVATMAGARGLGETNWELLATRYLSFLLYAYDPGSKRFSNFMNYERVWTKPNATEDVHARAIWSLSHVVVLAGSQGLRAMAMQLLEEATPITTSFSSPRSWAWSILGIQTYLKRYSGASLFRREREELAARLKDRFKQHAVPEWPWLEDSLTYANARIPHALLEAGKWLPDAEMFEYGIRALDWLDRLQTSEAGHFVPIGSNGWYVRGGEKARFDQQPIEAYTMLDACIAAYRMTYDQRWLDSAHRAFDWFLGRNDLSMPLYDYQTGGCADGLQSNRLNQNHGAESTVVWLLSLLLMHELQDELNESRATREERTALHGSV